MLAVGVWGAIVGGRAIRVWPMAFVAMMLVGFATAVSGIAVPLVEPAVWLSVVVLGLLVALAVNAPMWCGAAIIGLLAFFHGHVHGTEAAAGASWRTRRGSQSPLALFTQRASASAASVQPRSEESRCTLGGWRLRRILAMVG